MATRPSPPSSGHSTRSRRSLIAWLAGSARRSRTSRAAEFQRFEHDQTSNRAAADSLAEASARLGDTGVALQKDLIRAGGSMRVGRGRPGKDRGQARGRGSARGAQAPDQSRDELAQAVESLLVELRSELQTRILAELTEMHEIQKTIRETTEAQAPRVAQQSRTALILVASLSQKEAELGDRTEQLRHADRGDGVRHRAADRAAGPLARDAERPGLAQGGRCLGAHGQAGEAHRGRSAGPAGSDATAAAHDPAAARRRCPSDLRARERELNRLIAELKMIRLLQSRLNDDTVEVDNGRPKTAVLPPALRREIEALKAAQEEIRDSLARSRAPLEAGEDSESCGNHRSMNAGFPGARPARRAFGCGRMIACVQFRRIQSNRR